MTDDPARSSTAPLPASRPPVFTEDIVADHRRQITPYLFNSRRNFLDLPRWNWLYSLKPLWHALSPFEFRHTIVGRDHDERSSPGVSGEAFSWRGGRRCAFSSMIGEADADQVLVGVADLVFS